jgi:hypothetical protein
MRAVRTRLTLPGGYRVAIERAGIVVREQLAIDRTQLMPAERRIRTVQVLAWVVIAVLFVAGWGEGTVMALRALLGQPYIPTPYSSATVGHQLMNIAQPLAVTLAAIVVLVLFRRHPRPASPFPAVRASTWLKTFVIVPLGSTARFALLAALRFMGVPSMDFPHPPVDGGAASLLYLLNSATAGPSEELALLAVVVTVLRRAGYCWTTVCIAAVVVRVPFHLYYGWGRARAQRVGAAHGRPLPPHRDRAADRLGAHRFQRRRHPWAPGVRVLDPLDVRERGHPGSLLDISTQLCGRE